MAGRYVTIERAAVRDSSNIAAIHIEQGEIEALGRLQRPIEPDARLAWRDWRRRGHHLRRPRQIGAGHYQQRAARPSSHLFARDTISLAIGASLSRSYPRPS